MQDRNKRYSQILFYSHRKERKHAGQNEDPGKKKKEIFTSFHEGSRHVHGRRAGQNSTIFLDRTRTAIIKKYFSRLLQLSDLDVGGCKFLLEMLDLSSHIMVGLQELVGHNSTRTDTQL